MPNYFLTREQSIGMSPHKVFAFFSDAANLDLITPPWLEFRILTPTPIPMATGTRISYQICWHFFRMKWLSEIVDWDPPHGFTDVQIRGPYALWRHSHCFIPESNGTRIVDTVCYRLPLGPLGAALNRLKVRRDLESIFDYRAERIRALLEGDGARPRHPAESPGPVWPERMNGVIYTSSRDRGHSPSVRLRRKMW